MQLAIVLVAGVFAEPEPGPHPNALPEGKSEADAHAYYITHGYYPAYYTGYSYPYLYYGKKKRSADSEPVALANPDAEAAPEGKSDADAWYYYRSYGYWPSWYHGGYYRGYYYGKKKRSADAEPVPKPNPEGRSEADAKAWYAYYGYYPTWYTTGYYGYYPYYYYGK